MERLEIAFCGNSVYLSGLAASLRQNPLLRITQIDSSMAMSLNDLKMLCPDIVVTEALERDVVNALQRENSHLLVITIEAATDTLDVFADRQQTTLAVADLAQIITEYAGEKYARERHDPESDGRPMTVKHCGGQELIKKI